MTPIRSTLALGGLLATLAACSQVQTPVADPVFSPTTQALGTTTYDSGSQLAYGGNGAIYVAGETTGSLDFPNKGGSDIFLRRYSSDKTVVWRRQIASSASDNIGDLAADGGGQLYVGGWQGSTCFHSKYSAGGTLLWKRLYTACGGGAMAVDRVGNIYLTEDISEPGGVAYELRKYTSSGALGYVTTLDGTGMASSGVADVAVDNAGYAYVLAREFDDYAWEWVDRVSPTGAPAGSLEYLPNPGESDGLPTSDTHYADIEIVGNALYAVGDKTFYGPPSETNSNDPFNNPLESDALVVKYSLNGKRLWHRTFGTKVRDAGTAVTADALGNVYAVAETRGSVAARNAGDDDIVVRRYTAAGQTSWTKQFGGVDSETVYEAVATAGRGATLYLTGTTGGALEGGTYRGATDAFLLRRDGLGNKIWTDQ